MDDFQTRALANLRKRHEDRIRLNAKLIKDYTGHLLAHLDDGRIPSDYAHSVSAYAREIVTHLAALEAISEAVGILETTEG